VHRLLRLIGAGGMVRGSHARQVVWTGNDEGLGTMLLLTIGTQPTDALVLRLKLNCCLGGGACAHGIGDTCDRTGGIKARLPCKL